MRTRKKAAGNPVCKLGARLVLGPTDGISDTTSRRSDVIGYPLQVESVSWQPIHENHAIDVMAVKLDFAELVPQTLLRKMLRVAEETAIPAGLKSRHTLSGQLAGAGIVIGAVQGQLFNATVDAKEDDPVPQRVSEQLQVDQASITYRTWRYVSWSWQVQRMRELLLPLLEALSGVIAVARVQEEYLDRFKFDGPLAEAKVPLLLREGSPFVVPHGFNSSTIWHSHSGTLLPSEDNTRCLQTINVDFVDNPPEGDNSRRWANIVTMRQDTFSQQVISEGGPGGERVFAILDKMHGELKEMLAALITDSIAARIYLKDPS